MTEIAINYEVCRKDGLCAFVGAREDVDNHRRESLGDGHGNISADADGVVWVVIDPETRQLDSAATKKIRAERSG